METAEETAARILEENKEVELTPAQLETKTLKEENEKLKEQAKLNENDKELEELRNENIGLKQAKYDKSHSKLSKEEKTFIEEHFKDKKEVSINKKLDFLDTMIKFKKDIYSKEKNNTKILEVKTNKEESKKAMEEWDKMFQT